MKIVTKWKVVLATTAVWFACGQIDGLSRIHAEDDLAAADFSDELPRIPATDPDEALETFEVAEGFDIQLVASEPLIGTPVAIEWDSAGGLFVCEMRGYSEDREEGISQISRLTDSDGDGVYDRSTVYADGLYWPTGLFPYDGGLFVGDAPDLYYFKDTNSDGKADIKKLVLTGFGTSNVQGLMNSFRWGLDNRIHIACSSVGGQIRRPDQPESDAVNVRGRDIAFNPETGEFEPTSGAAQHGMCFDDWGRKFVSSNSDHLQQVMYEDHYIARNPHMQAPPARITIAADGPQAEVFRISPVEPWRIVRTRLRVSGAVRGPVEGGGRAAGYFTGATGVTIYRGDAWPKKWKGLAIIGDVGSNLVHRKRLEADGLKMVGKRIDPHSEFIASNDIWFRPAQFANAPDGSLHIVDVCREVIEHPKSLPPAIKKHLDLTSGRNRGRIYRVVDEDFQHRPTPRLQTATTEELVGLLEHRNAWHRETAARLLYQRQDPTAIADLRHLVRKSASPLARMHALYVLSGLGKLDPPSVLEAVDDSHPHVRRHAVRLAETIRSVPKLQDKLAGLANDPSLLVRYQLAFTAGSISGWNPVEALATIIRQDVEHRYMQAAVQSSVVQHAGPLFTRLVADSSFRSPEAGEFLTRLAEQINRQQDPDAVKQALQVVPQLPVDDAAFALPILGELLKSRSKAGSLVAKMDSQGELDEVDQAVDRMIAIFMKRAGQTELPANRRVEAIRALKFASVERVADLLQSLIDSTETIEVQRAAINTLGSFATDQVSATLIDQWNTFSPSLRETASEVMFARRGRLSALLDAIEEGNIPLSEISRTRLQATAKTGHPSIRSRVQKLLAKSGSEERSKIVAEYRKALSIEGDVERGRKLFAKHCSTCHRVENQGHEIGPNLATIKTRGPETILVNVLDPNAEVNPQYLSYIVLTIDGRTISGMISSESANSITLKRADAESDQVLRSDIERLQSSGLSIMPEGFEKELSPAQIADLIAYLMQVQ